MNRNLVKQAQQLQAKLAKVQEELEVETVEASSGGGMVTVVATGKLTIQSISIDSAVVDATDIEILEDLVLAAINEALNKAQTLANERMAAITGGLGIPGL